MKTNRILLIHNDVLLLKLYREKLEESGFAVDATSQVSQVPRVLANRVPDVVLLDLVFNHGSPLDVITVLREQSATSQAPILILPTVLSDIGSAAIQSGATQVIQPGASPIASIISAVKVSLGMPALGNASNAALFKPDQFWLDTILASAPATINEMRYCLPGISGTPPDLGALHQLWALVHGFAEKAMLLPYKPLAEFAAVLDLLLHDLNEAPGQLNVSTLRTVGQAIDFLATITQPDEIKRLPDPSAANVLVVDDEPTALLVISAALQIAGLKCESASTADSGLEKAGRTRWDLIFLDIGLPQVDGFELCTRLRAIESHKVTPLVFITGMATFHNKAKACLSGGNDFVGKPFNLPELGVKALLWIYRGRLGLSG